VLVAGLAVGLVAGAGLALIQPVHQRLSTASTLAAKVVTLPQAPRAGSVVTLAVPDGFMVEEGDVLATLETGSVDRHAALLEAARVREKARAEAPTPGQQNPALVLKVRADLARAKKDLAALDAKKVTGAARDSLQAQVASATAELDALTGGTAQSEARARLKALDEELEKVADERARSVIVAPSAGWFVAPPHALGLDLAPQAPFGVVLSRQANVTVPAPLPAKGVPEMTLVFGSTRVPVRDVKVVSTPSGPALQGTVELPGILHPPAAMTSGLPVPVELDYGIKPYWRTLVASRLE
jgi:multidrug efflux pump subunit AcrA (membrane-fusion protein)